MKTLKPVESVVEDMGVAKCLKNHENVATCIMQNCEFNSDDYTDALTQDRLASHKAVVEVLEGMKKNVSSHVSSTPEITQDDVVTEQQMSYNQALTDAIQKMDKLFGVSK